MTDQAEKIAGARLRIEALLSREMNRRDADMSVMIAAMTGELACLLASIPDAGGRQAVARRIADQLPTTVEALSAQADQATGGQA